MATPEPTNARVAIQLVISGAAGALVPQVLFAAGWRVGEWQEYPAAAFLFACGFALVPVSPKSWWVAEMGALIGLYFSSQCTGEVGFFYLWVLSPWAWAGGLIGRLVWYEKHERSTHF